MTGVGSLLQRIEVALAGSTPAPLEQALQNLALPGDLPGSLRGLLDKPWKPAAVLVPLLDYADTTRVLLTRRTSTLRHHAGQISFPGGALEESDKGPVDAALRETREETGMDTQDVQVVGFLDTYLTITGFAVTPVVARVPPGKDLRPDPTEVAELFEVPLPFLMNPDNHRRHVGKRDGLRVQFYSIPYRDWNIWGATAGMLVNLYSKL